MSDFKVNLTNCDNEPIHIPGRIQSHGILIAVDKEHIVRFCSDNLQKLTGTDNDDLLNNAFTSIQLPPGNEQAPNLITELLTLGVHQKNFDHINPFQITINGTVWNLVISISDEYFLLEFEPERSDFTLDVQKMIGHAVSEMLADKNLDNLMNNISIQVKKITGFDRVMVYRFAEDGHGEVAAESRNENLAPWLGLHYPASDIPKQARELYKKNLTRLIADVNATPSGLTHAKSNTSELNLSHSQLRAVSPIHIQYLKNMGVASSFSISLIYKTELWGLIACHNYTPRFIDYQSRESSKLLGQILSSALEFRQDEENQHIKNTFKNNLNSLTRSLQKSDSVEDAISNEPSNFLNAFNATGGVWVYENSITKAGITPGDDQLAALLNWIKENINEPIFYTHTLSTVYPEALAYKACASGMLVCILSSELNEYLIWFKPEKIKTVNWAGNPAKPITTGPNGLMQISPRNSFEAWSQQVSGSAEPWSVETINSVSLLKEEIVYAVNMKAGVARILTEKLRKAYEELDTFSYTISHDLKNPLTAIKGYTQLLQNNLSIADDAKKILLRIEARADKMNTMIDEVLEYSRMGREDIHLKKINVRTLIDTIVQDMDLAVNQVKIIIGATPDIMGDATMIYQLFLNLISNAVKYSRSSQQPRIHLNGVIGDTEIVYSIEDNGLGIATEDIPHIFKLFKRMDNAKEIEGSGVGLAIVKRIIEKHNGRIWVESTLNEGSSFSFSVAN